MREEDVAIDEAIANERTDSEGQRCTDSLAIVADIAAAEVETPSIVPTWACLRSDDRERSTAVAW